MIIDRGFGFPAIYSIELKGTERRYIGSAKNLAKRWHTHRLELRKGRHHSKHLQRTWNKYGESAFEFIIIERLTDAVSKDTLIASEQYWLDKLRPSFNNQKFAYSPLGTKHTKASKIKMGQLKAKLHRFRSPDGVVVEIHDLKQFCKDNGLNQGHMSGVHRGIKFQYKGWRSCEAFVWKEPKPHRNLRVWLFISPEGKITETVGLAGLCSDFGLEPSEMSRVNSGERPSHKGWTRYVEPEERIAA